jgi:hypothetical protein
MSKRTHRLVHATWTGEMNLSIGLMTVTVALSAALSALAQFFLKLA